MPPKENPEMTCEECIHYWACSRQCGEPMAQGSATGCECYEPIKSSMAYYVGTLDGAKGEIPNRLRELAEADKSGRCVVLPCKVGDKIYYLKRKNIIEAEVIDFTVNEAGAQFFTVEIYAPKDDMTFQCDLETELIGKTVFFKREEAEKALQEMEGK